MEFVINIDENTYKHFKDNCYSRIDIIAVHNALDYGIPLPKGHGDLIDRNEVEKLEEKICTTECSCCSSDKCFYEYAEPIIKTDWWDADYQTENNIESSGPEGKA